MPHVAYAGPRITVIWGTDFRGREHAKEYFDALPEQDQNYLRATMRLLGDAGWIRNETRCRDEGQGVYCLKTPRKRRIAAGYNGRHFVLTHGFDKGSDKMTQADRDKSGRLLAEHVERERKARVKSRG